MVGMFKSSATRICLFLHVRTHSQMQYYLNLHNTRRAANESALELSGAPYFSNVVQLHPLNRRNRVAP
jgi:hypothetical protein